MAGQMNELPLRVLKHKPSVAAEIFCPALAELRPIFNAQEAGRASDINRYPKLAETMELCMKNHREAFEGQINILSDSPEQGGAGRLQQQPRFGRYNDHGQGVQKAEKPIMDPFGESKGQSDEGFSTER